MYTAQRRDLYTQLYDFGARYYDSQLGRFIQADTIVPDPGNSQAWNRYMFVEGNPLIFIDPSGHEKVIILYGRYADGSHSWYAAAYTQYQKMLEMGYTSDEIAFHDVETEAGFQPPIEHSEVGEIEHFYFFGHSYVNGEGGGLQLSTGKIEWRNFESEDIDSTLSNRFDEDAVINLRGCLVAKESFPQDLADDWQVTVKATTLRTKFWSVIEDGNGNSIYEQYEGKTSEVGEYDKVTSVVQEPYRGKGENFTLRRPNKFTTFEPSEE